MKSFLRCAAAVFYKDLLSELRRREYVNSLLFFSLLTIFLFSFAMGTEPDLLRKLAPGLYWMILIFSATLALERSFFTELDAGCLDGLLLYSTSLRAVFLGKWASNFFFIGMVQILVALMMTARYKLESPRNPPLFFAGLLLANIGISTLGTFYAALVTQSRARQVLLPLLLFPMLIPLLLGSVYVTEYALSGDPFHQATLWLKLLVAYDSIFLAACFAAIEPLLEA